MLYIKLSTTIVMGPQVYTPHSRPWVSIFSSCFSLDKMDRKQFVSSSSELKDDCWESSDNAHIFWLRSLQLGVLRYQQNLGQLVHIAYFLHMFHSDIRCSKVTTCFSDKHSPKKTWLLVSTVLIQLKLRQHYWIHWYVWMYHSVTVLVNVKMGLRYVCMGLGMV